MWAWTVQKGLYGLHVYKACKNDWFIQDVAGQPEGTRLHEISNDTLQDNVTTFLREIGWAEWIKCCWPRIRPWAGQYFSARPGRLCGTLRLSSHGCWLFFSVGAWSWPFYLYLLQGLLSNVLIFVGLSSDKIRVITVLASSFYSTHTHTHTHLIFTDVPAL